MRACIRSVYGSDAKIQPTQLVTGDRVDACYLINGKKRNFSSKTVSKDSKSNSFFFPMTHGVNGKKDTPFAMKTACDVLCASATGYVLDELMKKFKQEPIEATTALFVYSKQQIVRGKTKHTVTEDCWNSSCILLKADRPINKEKAKTVFENVFMQNDAEEEIL
jgi:hypothetical protein